MIDVLVTLVSFVSPTVLIRISCNYLHLHYASSPQPRVPNIIQQVQWCGHKFVPNFLFP